MEKVSTDKQKIDQLLSRGVEEVIDGKKLREKLESGRQLRIKLGIDPTSPRLHIGRSIPLLKLRDFQELGHQIALIIGDFTGVIGDTSDKDSERPMLSQEIIESNLKTYAEQAGKILDISKCELRHNSKWLGKLNYHDIGKQADVFSVSDFIARDNIKRRLDAGKRVSLREMLYPLMQGYDSVAVEADVEVGGTDQKFNLLAGRDLQRAYGQEPQDIMTNPLLEGTDGRKMSSSWGNTVNLTDSPNDMYGKIMSIPDKLIARYLTLATRIPLTTISELEHDIESGKNPMDAKKVLAHAITDAYHGSEAADAGAEYFRKTISNKEIPDEIPTLKPNSYAILSVLMESGFAKSNSEGRRAIEQGGIKVNESVITDTALLVKTGDVIKKGKRHFIKVI